MSIVSHPLTYADLERARETTDERLELIAGEIVVAPSPKPFHQFVSQRLYDRLKLAVVDAGLGLIGYAPLDVCFSEQTILQPDLIVLLNDRVAQIGDDCVAGPPSLVIEIVSPSTSDRDQGTKRDLYAHYGVPEYWVVDPGTRTATVFSHPLHGQYRDKATSSETLVSVTIAGLSVDLAEIFAPVRRS